MISGITRSVYRTTILLARLKSLSLNSLNFLHDDFIQSIYDGSVPRIGLVSIS